MLEIISYKLPVILLFLTLILIIEVKTKKLQHLRNRHQRWLRNVSLFVVTGLVSAIIVVPLTQVVGGLTDWRAHYDVFNRAWVVMFDLCLLDLWIYCWHRANHQFDFLWRFHEIHHLDNDMDATTALRFHFGEVIISAVFRAVVMIVLDVPLLHIFIFEIMVMCAAIFHHARIILPKPVERYLYPILVTPSYHRIHHHAKASDLHSHYATILPIWDRVFGTYHGAKDTENFKMGVPNATGQRLADLPVLALLIRPFKKKL